jgi:hypothetical protein
MSSASFSAGARSDTSRNGQPDGKAGYRRLRAGSEKSVAVRLRVAFGRWKWREAWMKIRQVGNEAEDGEKAEEQASSTGWAWTLSRGGSP